MKPGDVVKIDHTRPGDGPVLAVYLGQCPPERVIIDERGDPIVWAHIMMIDPDQSERVPWLWLMNRHTWPFIQIVFSTISRMTK